MDRCLSENGILEAMDTWPKYGCNPDGRFLELTKETEADYVPYDDMVQAVTGTPVQDVAPVVHAHWEYRYDTGIYQTEFLCSRCKGLIKTYSCTVDEVEYEYCPNCGARMDEKEGE